MTIFTITFTSSPHPHLRRFDMCRDINPVADLVEQCFADTLDADGQRYLRRLRSTTRHPQLLRWASAIAERASTPFSGYVWEEDGDVVGNLSLMPMTSQGKRIFLIANVAVHPNYRRHGIARDLTTAAIEQAKRRNGHAIWLHVREDAPGALNLYQSMGFVERTRRTNWQTTREVISAPISEGITVQPRHKNHWPQQRTWLNRLHPPAFYWYLSLDEKSLRAGILGFLSRLLTGTYPRQWSATRGDQLLGTLTWQRSHANADRLWLAAPPEHEAEAILSLVPPARQQFPKHRLLNLEFPAGRSTKFFEAVGLHPHQTLIWMEYK